MAWESIDLQTRLENFKRQYRELCEDLQMVIVYDGSVYPDQVLTLDKCKDLNWELEYSWDQGLKLEDNE